MGHINYFFNMKTLLSWLGVIKLRLKGAGRERRIGWFVMSFRSFDG